MEKMNDIQQRGFMGLATAYGEWAATASVRSDTTGEPAATARDIRIAVAAFVAGTISLVSRIKDNPVSNMVEGPIPDDFEQQVLDTIAFLLKSKQDNDTTLNEVLIP